MLSWKTQCLEKLQPYSQLTAGTLPSTLQQSCLPSCLNQDSTSKHNTKCLSKIPISRSCEIFKKAYNFLLLICFLFVCLFVFSLYCSPFLLHASRSESWLDKKRRKSRGQKSQLCCEVCQCRAADVTAGVSAVLVVA